MKRAYIFAEGPTDAELLRRIVPQDILQDSEIVMAGGSSGIPSLARSILVRRKTPVAVLMDSDSVNPELIEERQRSMEEFIRAADASVPVKVVSAIPEIEAWFMVSPELIERLVGQPVSIDELTHGRAEPKAFLERLAKGNKRTWNAHQAIAELDTRDIERIRAIPQVAELNQFLERVKRGERAA